MHSKKPEPSVFRERLRKICGTDNLASKKRGRDSETHWVSITDTGQHIYQGIYNGYVMFTRILTDLERKKLLTFVEKDQIPDTLRLLISRIRRFSPQIEQDLELMHKGLRKYEKRRAHSA